MGFLQKFCKVKESQQYSFKNHLWLKNINEKPPKMIFEAFQHVCSPKKSFLKDSNMLESPKSHF